MFSTISKILVWKILLTLFVFAGVGARLVNNQKNRVEILSIAGLDVRITQANSRVISSRNSSENLKETSIKCQDEGGHPIDWFLAYKLAKIAKASDSNVKRGLGYSFIQPGLSQWKLSERNINESDSIVGKTVDILFSKGLGDGNFLYLTYNDQPPDAPTINNNGHTKGVIIANEAGGIFLQHSVPHFPPIFNNTTRYSYPSSGVHNGQVFFCLSLTPQQLDTTLGNILQISKPNIFKYSFPSRFNQLYSNLKKLVPSPKKKKLGKFKTSKTEEYPSLLLMKHQVNKSSKVSYSKTGQQQRSGDFYDNIFNLAVGQLNLTVFAKSPKMNVELYADFIGPYLKTNLSVQSWLNGPHALTSNCSSKTLSVMNILSKSIDGDEFSTTSDHSKWAIGGTEKWTCIADLNRMQHQYVRGGLALCHQHPDIWTSFQTSVVDLMPCPKKIGH